MGNELDPINRKEIYKREKKIQKERMRKEKEAHRERLREEREAQRELRERLREERDIQRRNHEIERENQRILKQQRLERIRQIREENERRRREILRQNLERQRDNNLRRMGVQNNYLFPSFFNNQREDEINNGFMNENYLEDFPNQNNNFIFNFNEDLNNDNGNKRENNNNNNIGDMLEEIGLTQDIINKAESKECPICLEEYSIENKICYLPCFHFFHSMCIKNWLKNSHKCPLCNNDIKFE